MKNNPLSEAAWAHQQAEQHHDQSGMQLLRHGLEAYARRILLAERAEQSLDIQIYLFEDGHSTRRILLAMIAAAERGVKVRLLLDDLSVGNQQGRFAQLDSHPNIEVRLFNPVRWGRRFTVTRLLSMALNVRRLHRRMHNKLWIVDGANAIWGGRNLSDVYFSAETENTFIDLDVLGVGGDVVRSLVTSFDTYWQHPLVVPLKAFITAEPHDWRHLQQELEAHCAKPSTIGQRFDEGVEELRNDSREELLERLTWASGRVLYDSPEAAAVEGRPPEKLRMSTPFARELETVEHSLVMTAGYFIPEDTDRLDVQALLARGVKLTVITNALESTDVPLVHGGYGPWRAPLLAQGVRLYEIRHRTRIRSPLAARLRSRTRLKLSRPNSYALHAKTYALDDDRLMVGSFNFDPRSVWWNCELGVVIDSEVLNKELREINAVSMLPEFSYRLKLVNGKLRWSSISHTGKFRHYYWERGNLWRCFQALVGRIPLIKRVL
ncbi:phospholipase D family protein [Carnimonas nigrificans]|uniref:phospholipase D family protein n=1 Tax=Carnimonas nigrificans TaxID=64323 RepID=UPI00046EB902|nr:phospholipase D family protein [Carnimonas nigrificans]